MHIIYKDVTSSNIEALAFAGGRAYVEFKGGKRFAYAMSQGLFDQMATAASIGSFFARNVKGKCPVMWSGERCNLSPCANDATVEGFVAGGRFVLCDSCAKHGRYKGVELRGIELKPIEQKAGK